MTMELIRSFCNCAPCLPSSLFSALQMSFFMRSQQQRSSTSCSLTSSSSLVKEESRPSRCLRVPSCSCCFLLRNCWLQMESASTLALLVQWCILPMLLSSSAEEQINTDHSIRQRVDYIQREEMARRGKSSHQRCCGMEEGMGGWRAWVGRCLYLNMFYLIVAVQLVLALLYVAYLIHQYSMPQVSAVVKILVYLTWLLSFIIVVILPYDVYHSLQSDYTMSVVWKVIYYLIFILTWLLLPVAQEYETAGEFTPKEKFKTALINNLIIYGIFAVLGVAFVVYLSLKDKLNLEELTPVLMAASNAFGMFLVVIFLSHGLVAIPKQLWREKKYEIKLKQKQFAAVGLAHKKEKIIQELQLKVKELYWHIKKNGESVESNYIANLIPERYREKWRKNVPDLGEVHLVKLHREIKEQLLQLARLQRRWEELVEQTFLIEDILTNVSNPNRRIESTLFSSSRYEFVNYGKWLWYCRMKAYLTPIMAIFFSLFAAAVIIAQVAVFLPSLSFLNPFGRLVQMETFIGLDCSLMVVMSYVVFCVYYSLFKLKFANYYGLYWNRQTDASSLMFFAINCSRVSTPLCYNFLQIINNQRTAFSKVMGEANLVPVFGETFPIIFPILLIILIVVNIFDVYAMIAKMFGLQKFQFESGFQHENIDEGKRLLQKARIQIENRILNSNNKDLREYRSYRWETGLGSQQPTRKESSSSEQIALSGGYYNQFANMHNAGKILAL